MAYEKCGFVQFHGKKVKSRYLLPAICCEAAKHCGSLIPQLTRNFGYFAANDVVAGAKFK